MVRARSVGRQGGRLSKFSCSGFFKLSGAVGVILVTSGQAGAPPVRLGLWEIASTTTLVSEMPFQIPPAQAEQLKRMGIPVPGVPTTRTDQSCVNAQSFDKLGEPDRKGRTCHRQNVQLSAAGLSADIICDQGGTEGRGRIDLVFDDTTHFHGTIAMKGRSSSAPGVSGVDISMQGHWLGGECGRAKPLGE